MQENILIILINLLVIAGVGVSVIKFRYDKQLQGSRFKIVLYWIAVAMILAANVLSIFHNIHN